MCNCNVSHYIFIYRGMEKEERCLPFRVKLTLNRLFFICLALKRITIYILAMIYFMMIGKGISLCEMGILLAKNISIQKEHVTNAKQHKCSHIRIIIRLPTKILTIRVYPLRIGHNKSLAILTVSSMVIYFVSSILKKMKQKLTHDDDKALG